MKRQKTDNENETDEHEAVKEAITTFMLWFSIVPSLVGIALSIWVKIQHIDKGISLSDSSWTVGVEYVLAGIVVSLIIFLVTITVSWGTPHEDLSYAILTLTLISIMVLSMGGWIAMGLSAIGSAIYSNTVQSSEDVVNEKITSLGYENVDTISKSTLRADAIDGLTDEDNLRVSAYDRQISYADKDGKSYAILIGFDQDKSMFVQKAYPLADVSYAK